jgi:hypothetical protein
VAVLNGAEEDAMSDAGDEVADVDLAVERRHGVAKGDGGVGVDGLGVCG